MIVKIYKDIEDGRQMVAAADVYEGCNANLWGDPPHPADAPEVRSVTVRWMHGGRQGSKVTAQDVAEHWPEVEDDALEAAMIEIEDGDDDYHMED